MNQDYDLKQGAKRLETVSFSPIRVVMEKAREMVEKGYPVISFSAGEPNFNTPEPIKEATIAALKENLTHYSSNRGVLALREEIAKKTQKESGVSYDPVSEIILTNSGAEAINNALLATVNPGDEVIVFTPAFINYESLVKMCGATVIDIPLKPENRFQIDIEEVRSKISEHTKMVIMNNPCNPTGAVYHYEDLKALAELAIENNFLIFADEIYNCLTYGDSRFVSVSCFPGMKDHSIIMNGFSKTYAMTGWRLGYLMTDATIMDHIVKVHQYSTTSGNTFIQTALARSMNTPETMKEVNAMVSAFASRKILMMKELENIDKLSFIEPDGAFYMMVDVSKTGMDGTEFADRLLKEKYVAVVPAIGLGKECGDFIRMSFATSDENIVEGMKRIREFVDEL